jgi:hypothetical protein
LALMDCACVVHCPNVCANACNGMPDGTNLCEECVFTECAPEVNACFDDF